MEQNRIDEANLRGSEVMKELRGMPAAKAMLTDLQVRVEALKEKGLYRN